MHIFYWVPRGVDAWRGARSCVCLFAASARWDGIDDRRRQTTHTTQLTQFGRFADARLVNRGIFMMLDFSIDISHLLYTMMRTN